MAGSLVHTLNAQKAVVAQRIDAVYMNAAPAPSDYVLDFGALIESASAGFTGRDSVFAALDTFCQQHSNGYFEIVADAGLGKTALAAEITRRRDAIAFFASASRGLRRPEQFLNHVCGRLVTRYGLEDKFVAQSGENNVLLDRLLREAVSTSQREPLFVVVDALDEADEPPTESNALLLPAELPQSVYFVVTHRGGRDLITLPSTPVQRHVIGRDDPDQRADIAAFVRRQVTESAQVARALAEAAPPVLPDYFVARLTEASEGNFMYVSYVLADTAALEVGSDPLDQLPSGLKGYYQQFWSRLQAFQSEGWDAWNNLYRPIIERLGVAAEAISAEWLAAQVGRPAAEIRDQALHRWERLLSREMRGGQERWRIVHRSFADFLEEKVDLRAANVAVADGYAVGHQGDWGAWDDYGLRHTATHLVEGARRSTQPDRHTLTERLVALLTDPAYQSAHLDRLRDPTLLESDLVSAVRAVADDDDVRAPLLAVEVSLTLMGFRREQRRPEPIFALARAGQVGAAVRRLDLFSLEVDRDWYLALLLTIAWLAASSAPNDARSLRDRVNHEGFDSSTVKLLAERLDASLGDGSVPNVHLPPPPPHEDSAALVERLGGEQGGRFLNANLPSELRDEVMGDGGYLAEHDGPLLVAAAANEPAFGEPLLQRYLAIHSAYGYRQYRQGSLWALLKATLQHPSQEWVRMWVPALGEAALAPNRGEFAEGLALAALLVRALAGDSAAFTQLEQRREQSLKQAQALDLSSTRRGAGDTWGIIKRRLSSLAEAFSRLPNESSQASTLLSTALSLQYGFAGFHAPACLSLAEAIEVAGAGQDWSDAALRDGLRSAHNIQDETFCARTAARMNAMRERWWATPIIESVDVIGVAERLLRDSSDSEFAAVHIVGEAYVERDSEATTPLTPEVREARTLEELAGAYKRPLVDFLRVNAASGWTPQHSLDDGVRVNVPDPGFPPMIATRLAARALADAHLSADERIRAASVLVPAAASEPTALHTVLGRLLLAWHPTDATTLSRLTDLAASSTEHESPDDELAGRLTGFIP